MITIIILKGSVTMIHAANAPLGASFIIKAIQLENPNMLHRLNALGFSEGSEVQICRKSLFKGPCTLKTDNQQICIRNCDACKIILENYNA